MDSSTKITIITNPKKPVCIENEHRYDFTQTTEDHNEVWRLYASHDELWAEDYKGRIIGEIRKLVREYKISTRLGGECLMKSATKDQGKLKLVFEEMQRTELEILLRLARGNKQLDVFENYVYPTII